MATNIQRARMVLSALFLDGETQPGIGPMTRAVDAAVFMSFHPEEARDAADAAESEAVDYSSE